MVVKSQNQSKSHMAAIFYDTNKMMTSPPWRTAGLRRRRCHILGWYSGSWRSDEADPIFCWPVQKGRFSKMWLLKWHKNGNVFFFEKCLKLWEKRKQILRMFVWDCNPATLGCSKTWTSKSWESLHTAGSDALKVSPSGLPGYRSQSISTKPIFWHLDPWCSTPHFLLSGSVSLPTPSSAFVEEDGGQTSCQILLEWQATKMAAERKVIKRV